MGSEPTRKELDELVFQYFSTIIAEMGSKLTKELVKNLLVLLFPAPHLFVLRVIVVRTKGALVDAHLTLDAPLMVSLY